MSRSKDSLCPECGSAALVRGIHKTDWLLRSRYLVRCLTCGVRFQAPREFWEHLRWPQLGEPYESTDDKSELMKRLPMTAGQTVCVCLGVIFSVVTVFYLLFAINLAEFLAFSVFLPIVYAAWWIGRFLFPAGREPR
ncbi:MAG: hypothetical protein ACE5I3_02305 [Phycisphaerae bacterium]